MSDRAAILDALQPDYAVASTLLPGVSLRPAPATVVASLMAREDGFDEVVFDGALFEDDAFLKAMVDPDALHPVFLRLILACLPSDARKRVAALDAKDFLLLAVEAFAASMPMAVGTLFEGGGFEGQDEEDDEERPSQSLGPDIDVAEDPAEIAIDIHKVACRLRASGHSDAYEMSWTRLRFAQAVEAERSREGLANAAVAARIGQADQKAWKRFMKGLGR